MKNSSYRYVNTAVLYLSFMLFGCQSGTSDEGEARGAGQAGDASTWVQPLTEWGEPDIRGMWPIGHLTGVSLQRAEGMGDRRELTDEELAAREKQYTAIQGGYDNEIRTRKMGMGHWVEWGQVNRLTSLLVDPPDGRLPALTPEGERRRALMRSGWMTIPFDRPTDFDNWDRCITRGLPASMLPAYYNNGIEIFQAPGFVVFEMIHETRIIPTDGRPPVDAGAKAWFGFSRGRWDGNTLVVETTNFNGEGSSTNIHTVGSPPFNNTPISTEYKLTERFTRTGPETMTYQATVDDPVIWTKPWTVELPWRRDDSYEIYEYACHEDNSMVRNYIETSRFERAKQAGK